MQQWHEQGPNGTNGQRIHEMNDLNLRYFTLPLSELSSRESIVQQQVLARAINTWHHSQFPVFTALLTHLYRLYLWIGTFRFPSKSL
ncbi:hypothetical protein CPB86DRAFT_511373 [Serendipita vermifera]|nr:hypothetical protein CPB86DRAFT_511373 [Serendipita vermifera]